MKDHAEFTDQPVYVIYEYNEDGLDSPEMVFEDDADTLSDVLDYGQQLAAKDSAILPGRFHAAYPGDKYLSQGDWYLKKHHGIGISEGFQG